MIYQSPTMNRTIRARKRAFMMFPSYRQLPARSASDGNRRLCFLKLPAFFSALKVRNNITQGNATAPFQGFNLGGLANPGRCPGLVCFALSVRKTGAQLQYLRSGLVTSVITPRLRAAPDPHTFSRRRISRWLDAVHQHLRRARPAVVVGTHRHAVGPGAERRQQFAARHGRQSDDPWPGNRPIRTRGRPRPPCIVPGISAS